MGLSLLNCTLNENETVSSELRNKDAFLQSDAMKERVTLHMVPHPATLSTTCGNQLRVGESADITILREGNNSLQEFTLKRAQIIFPCEDYLFLLEMPTYG